MKVVFLYPRWTSDQGIAGWFARRNSSWPPLNLALLAACVERAGHEAVIVDGQSWNLSADEAAQQTLAHAPDVVALTATSPFFHVQVDVAQRIKGMCPQQTIVIGGPHISIVKDKALLPCFDFAFTGEAEQSFVNFLDGLPTRVEWSELPGLIWRNDAGMVVLNDRPPWQSEFDQLPFPARHLLPMERYRLGTLKGRLPFTTIQTTRGCPWKCIFCASKALNTNRILRRSPRSVVDEIKQVVDRFNVRHFMFLDDVLTLNPEHILEICDLIAAEKLDITFEGSTRANLVTEPMIKRMEECGLIRLSFGLETVDSDMRDIMKKKVPLHYYTDANRILNMYNVEALNSVMIGLPGETRETVRKTLDFLANAREVKQANFAITIPYPGTELHEMALNGQHGMKLLSDDFSKYRRYGAAVTEVNGLTPQDLIDLQNEGFVAIYSAPWRWRPMYGKYGVIGCALTFWRLLRLIFQRLVRRTLGRPELPQPS